MFNFVKDFRELKSTNKSLEKEKKTLKEEVADLKLKKKIEDEDIKHLVKLKQEQQEVEFAKRTVQMDGEKAEAIAEVKDKYRDKMEEQLKAETDNIKTMYGEILKRLPNVNVKLKGDV